MITVLAPARILVAGAGVQEGRSYKEIALAMSISPHTVHSHIKHIYEKLQASDKRDAIVKARRKGLL